jgi:type IX secretion system PorP/SprF family membrane protein
MNKRIAIIFTLVLALAGLRGTAQDALFSQYYANPLYLNPAFAGTNVCPRLAFHFRDQWPSLPGTFMTYSASYDEHFDKISGGVGILLLGDRAGEGGIINTYSASAMYSFKLKVSKKFNLRFALQATYEYRGLNWENLVFGDMIDPKYGVVYQTQEQPDKYTMSIHSFDMAAGILGYTPHLYFGVAAHHIVPILGAQGFISNGLGAYDYRPVKWTAHIGAYFDLKRKSKKETSFGDISISPNFIYQHQQNFNYFSEGFYLNFYPFTVGCWLRHGLTYKGEVFTGFDENGDPRPTETVSYHNMDAFIVMFGLEYEWFKVAYSYDATISKLANYSGGAHEVSLQFMLPCPEKHKAMKDLKCPSF